MNPPDTGDERTMLTSFLDHYRQIIAAKCADLSDADAHRRVLPASPDMTVAGLVSHLRWVEHYWFDHLLLGRPDRGPWTDDDPDAEFHVADRTLASLLADYASQSALARQAVADLSLDAHTALERRGQPVSLRWVLHHMIEETARHAGHLDIIRELLDGTRGD